MWNPFKKSPANPLGEHSDPSQEQQKELGRPQTDTSFSTDHSAFMQTVLDLLESKKISTSDPMTFVKTDVYESLSEEMCGKVDLSIPNIASILDRIMDLHLSPEQNESFEMKSLIETLWQAKERIEGGESGVDVFVF